MSRQSISVLLAGLLTAGLAAAGPAIAAIVVTDDSGRVHRRVAPAQRIVSLAPHTTELLFAIGAGTRVVGVSAISNYPEAARSLPAISAGARLDIEQIVALRPDLAIGWQSGNSRADLERLEALGIPVFIAEPRRLEGLPETLIALGRIAGSEPGAEHAAHDFRARLAQLREQYRARPPVRVFLEIAAQPLITLNHRHLINDVLALCGGRNIFAASDLVAPNVSIEAVVIEDPDAILYSDALASEKEMRAWWRDRAGFAAARSGRVYAIPAEQTLRQTPRVLEGAKQVCETLDGVRASLGRQPD